MMPSASGSLDSGSLDVEAVDSIDGPRLRPTASAGARSNAGGRPGDRRVRDDALAAERDLSAAERDLSAAERDLPPDRDLPAERVRALTDEVAALEAEVEALERVVESKERQRQQVIDNYESIVAARRAPDRSSETDAAASEPSDGRGLLATVASGVGRVAGWLRPDRE
ncbi:hypothetical protein [Halorubrum sodomense]|nr:hypothetical protein [Halorubrum sodomense]